MEGVKADDFAALLAALNSRSTAPAPQPPAQFQPPQYMWQPVPIQQPLPPAPVPVKAGVNIWIVVLLLIAALVFCALAWMRTTKMVAEETKEEEEAKEEEEEAPAELPVPAQAVPESREYEYDEDAVRDFVSANLLNFSKQQDSPREPVQNDVFHIPSEELPAEVKVSSKRLADESQEVLDYAKRREALFKN